MRFLLVLLLLLPSLLRAQEAYSELVGAIPLTRGKQPSSDLLYQGKNISPWEAWELGETSDISQLEPMDSELWRPSGFPVELSGDQVHEELIATYKELLPTRSGQFRFSVETAQGKRILLLNKTIHNVFLRKEILRKLGYQVPPSDWVKTLRLEFKNHIQKESFIQTLKERTLGDPKRWILEEGERELLLQDLASFDDFERIYNFSTGSYVTGVIQGRRVMRALVIPLSLVDLPESVNMLTWDFGRILSNNLIIHSSEDFDPSTFDGTYEDSRWIARKLAKLSREDWEEIVEGAHFPPSVASLLVEKLISRRNNLLRLMKLEGEGPRLTYFPKLGMGEDLVNGKLLKNEWDGYASRFAYGDPDSPFSGKEAWAFVKSRALSTLLLNATSYINSIPYLSTDINSKYEDHVLENFAEIVEDLLKNGPDSRLPVATWGFPYYDVDLNVSRDVVLGNYMGTNNKVQLADSISASAAAGIFWGIDNVPIPLVLTGTAQASVTRNYTHIKPVSSIKAALKQPYRNLIIPYLKNKTGNIFSEIGSLEFDSLSEADQLKLLKEKLKEFGKQIEVGESFIITDSIGASVALKPTGTFLTPVPGIPFVQLSNSWEASQRVLWRLHIHRSSESKVQIYRDRVWGPSFSAGLGLSMFLNIVSVGAQGTNSRGQILFYELDLDTDRQPVGKVKERLLALRQILKTGSAELLRAVQKPKKIEFVAKERILRAGLFFYNWLRNRNWQESSITLEEGQKAGYHRYQEASSRGPDYESYVTGAISSLLSVLTKQNLFLSSFNSINPGNTLFGKAKNTIYTHDGLDTREIHKDSGISVSHIWNGWRIGVGKVKKIISSMTERWGHPLINDDALGTTKTLLLYQLTFNLKFHQQGVLSVLEKNDGEVYTILRQEKVSLLRIRKFLRLRDRYFETSLSSALKTRARRLAKIFRYMEDKFPLRVIAKLAGGEQNVFAFGKIEGFRKKDELGDTPIFSNSFGIMGSEALSPVEKLRMRLGMTDGEFSLSWFLTRVL